MARMFYGASMFNTDISSWNTSSVTDMELMFATSFNPLYDLAQNGFWSGGANAASTFNRDLNGWDVSNLKNMRGMFALTKSFNGQIDNWNTISVTNFEYMFAGAASFTWDIRRWVVVNAKVGNMFANGCKFVSTFECASGVNGPPSACYVRPFKTDYSLEIAINACFEQAHDGDCDCVDGCGEAGVHISKWNTTGMKYFQNLFYNRTLFNQDVGTWDTRSAVDMDDMFRNAQLFNHNLSQWDVRGVTDMSNMFRGATSFNYDVTNWVTRADVITTDMFKDAKTFNARYACSDIDDGPPNTCVVGDDCDASDAPAGGGVGDCTGSLASGSTCQPTCDDGYVVSGETSCVRGALRSATCLLLPSLTHWFDFSRLGDSNISSLASSNVTDLKGNATNIEVVGIVAFERSVQNGLGAVYFNEPTVSRTLRFRSSLLGRNPEVFVVFRVIAYSFLGTLIGDVGNGYGFGTYKAGDGFVCVAQSSGALMVKVAMNYSTWHLAHLYFGEGETDGFLALDSGERHSFGIAGKYLTSSHSRPEMGAFSGDRFDHMVESYVGEVAYFSSALTEEERTAVTSGLMKKWGLG